MKNVDDKDLDNVSGGLDTGPPSAAPPAGGNPNLGDEVTGGTTADPNDPIGQGGKDGANQIPS